MAESSLKLSAGEAARKLVHISAGFLALLLPWIDRWQGAAVCLGALVMNWLLLPRLTGHALERKDERRRGYAPGILLYPISVGMLFVLFGSRMDVVAGAWGILAFGDGWATLAGRAIGGPRLPWNRSKTFSGLVAFVIAGTAAAILLGNWVGGQAWTLGYLLAAALAALVESADTGINDNLSVPLMAGGVLFALAHVQAEQLSLHADRIQSDLPYAIAVNLVVSGLAWAVRTVKTSGAVVGFLIGVTVYAFGGWRAYLILILFFVLASGATKVGYERKAARKIAQEEGGRRGARHALANGGLPAALAFLAAATSHPEWLLVAFTAALATAVFDTVSSEIGQVYGRRTFLITSLKPVPPGTEGAVSAEGTLAGLAAAALLALAAQALGLMGTLGWVGAAVVVAAALIGTTVESLLGALVKGEPIDNEAMNFANTLVGALAALGLCSLLLS